MEKINLPKISEEKISETVSRVTIEPLFPGYGHTLGNSIRRVLLSSIPGAAVTSFKIENAPHEFTSLPHVKEDLIEIMMNLKSLKIKSFSGEPVRLTLSKKDECVATAADFSKNSDIEIINPEQVIATLDKNAKFDMEVIVETDRGFRSTDDAERDGELGKILIDTNFSPVERVKIDVLNTRVGQMTNYDKLVLEITTNGSISVHDCMVDASNILIEHYKVFAFSEEPKETLVESMEDDDIVEDDLPEYSSDPEYASSNEGDSIDPKTKIEDVGLSPRTANALLSSGIKTYAGLTRLSDLKLSEVKGLGKKGIEEIKNLMGNNEKA
ncbi:MAG: DNA-directed RNA polymerase subunit alpha [bacterium ADurb.Bin212]|nr:MAG: DNA-directed RNA polymerase subunit alpha [bacterium ADurb.Bin212]